MNAGSKKKKRNVKGNVTMKDPRMVREDPRFGERILDVEKGSSPAKIAAKRRNKGKKEG
jgi:hypothetical protein